MYDLNDETYWNEIKNDVINHIHRIPSGFDYSMWFTIVANMKSAGLSRAEVAIWCAEDGEPNNSTWNGIRDEGSDRARARGFLVKKAKENGYKLPANSKENSLLIAAKKWQREQAEKADSDDYMTSLMNEFQQYRQANNKTGDISEEAVFDEFIINKYIEAKNGNVSDVVTYDIFVDKKDKDGNVTGAEVNEKEVFRWLKENGFVCADYNKKLVNAKIEGHLVKRLGWDIVFAELNDYIVKTYPDKLTTWLKHTKFYTEHYFRSLTKIDIAIHEDEPKAAYLYFKNGIVKVSAESVEVLPWDDFNGYLWKDAFKSLDHDFSLNEDKSQFEIYMEKITGTEERKQSLMSIFGFYLHRFKSQGDIHCLYLTDNEASIDIKTSKGGTGKGTFFKGLEQFRKMLIVGGKTEEINGRFTLSGYEDGTSIILYDDVESTFNPEMLYVKISGDLEIEKKGKDMMIVPFDKAPKIGLNSNYILKNMNSESSMRRFIPFELQNFFSSKKTIYDFFGNNFFNGEWSVDEWNKFNTFAVKCLQLYFKNGIIKENNNDFHVKALLEDCNVGAFRDFAESYIIPKLSEQTCFSNNEIINAYAEYCRQNLAKPLGPKRLGEIMLLMFSPGCKRQRTAQNRGFIIDVNNWKCRKFYEKEDYVFNSVDPFLNEEEKEEEADDSGFLESAPDYSKPVETSVKKRFVTINRFKKDNNNEVIKIDDNKLIGLTKNNEEVIVYYDDKLKDYVAVDKTISLGWEQR